MNNNEENKGKKIIEKFQRRQTISIILTAIIVFLSPFLIISFYFSKFYKLEILKSIQVIMLVLILIIPVITVFLRRCPNCGHFFGRYNIAPTYCSKCGIKLK
ncbi:hypothetical protein IZY60_10115 [Lutibacter sp. B2]|nr:hypothetical protein [Lutibacter sp. B2]